MPKQSQFKAKQSQFQSYLAEMGPHELKYVDRFYGFDFNREIKENV